MDFSSDYEGGASKQTNTLCGMAQDGAAMREGRLLPFVPLPLSSPVMSKQDSILLRSLVLIGHWCQQCNLDPIICCIARSRMPQSYVAFWKTDDSHQLRAIKTSPLSKPCIAQRFAFSSPVFYSLNSKSTPWTETSNILYYTVFIKVVQSDWFISWALVVLILTHEWKVTLRGVICTQLNWSCWPGVVS